MQTSGPSTQSYYPSICDGIIEQNSRSQTTDHSSGNVVVSTIIILYVSMKYRTDLQTEYCCDIDISDRIKDYIFNIVKLSKAYA